MRGPHRPPCCSRLGRELRRQTGLALPSWPVKELNRHTRRSIIAPRSQFPQFRFATDEAHYLIPGRQQPTGPLPCFPLGQPLCGQPKRLDPIDWIAVPDVNVAVHEHVDAASRLCGDIHLVGQRGPRRRISPRPVMSALLPPVRTRLSHDPRLGMRPAG